MIGQTISHYRIVEKLGEGGMGVVYKAEDTNLRRTVALKFLTPQALGEPDTKARLIREAQAAASLDHPHICSVYGIHEEDSQTFIAMAYIEGASLAEKIKSRPLTLEEALNIAVQIGEGLQEAHEQGVVHRDIKPANIMLTRKGQVKIMDFGLAYLAGRSKLTKSGTTMGTPVYMSPEQALGQKADRRSDIWSLGVVFYEMLAAKSPFDDEYEQAIIYSIINESPEPLTARRTGLPVEIDRIVAKALTKQPDDRYQHVDELLVDLRALRKRGESQTAKAPLAPEIGLAQPAAQVQIPILPLLQTSPSLLRMAWGIAGAVLGAALTVGVYLGQKPRAPEPIRFVLSLPAGGEFSLNQSLAVSPDGKSVAFVTPDKSGRRLVWLRDLASTSAQPLPGTEGADYPFWSPDGRDIAFFADAKLKKVAVSGGPPEILCSARSSSGGTWGSSGEIVAALSSPEGLFRLPATGGEARPVTKVDTSRGENSHRWPHFLPDGRHFLYTARSSQAGNTTVYAGSLDSSEVRKILSVPSNAAYARSHDGKTGYLLYTRNGALLAQPFDAEALQLAGEPHLVAEGAQDGVASALSSFSVSADGRVLAFLAEGRDLLSWFDRDGEPLGSVGQPDKWNGVELSPDQQRVALNKTDPQTGIRDLWTIDLASGISSRLTSGSANAYSHAWSPEGRRIVYVSDPEGVTDLYVSELGTAHKPEPMLKSSNPKVGPKWSPDGRAIAYTSGDDLWMLPLFGDRSPLPAVQSEFAENHASFSPDGRWFAYNSNESGQWEIHVRTLPSDLSQLRPDRGRRVSGGGSWAPRWRGDGKELYYVDSNDTLTAVEVLDGQTFRTSSPKPLFRICTTAYGNPEALYDVTADGQRFLISCPAEQEAHHLQVWVNWAEALGQ